MSISAISHKINSKSHDFLISFDNSKMNGFTLLHQKATLLHFKQKSVDNRYPVCYNGKEIK